MDPGKSYRGKLATQPRPADTAPASSLPGSLNESVWAAMMNSTEKSLSSAKMPDDPKKVTLKVLRRKLEAAGLATDGRKAVLLERLEAYEKGER